ncbi:agmatine deiminase family protein [Methylomarinum sp. Ch1-1]|uniref:Agmatine deiminase family protein n=1 Tax=Methylomarinum roseum TaxID=3067653 RepID=A0AAU7NSY0_9GAMM|nr:agmatine deiminase family protein [Methylomarinum sp. Ch1-1]MDP4519891.1 agmatine deiminase family protein [Methylomarinum sp. Ch1-1]
MIRFPAEWEPQSAVIIAWPHPDGDFVNLQAVENSYRFIAETISRFQPLLIVCKDLRHRQHINSLLSDAEAISFIQADYNDIWLRDTVFLTIEDQGQARLLNFRFNGWGNKYEHGADNALNRNLLKHAIFQGLPTSDIDFVLEGGSLESDGQGTLLTTANCLLNPNRNPGMDQQAISRQLEKTLGAERILWLQQSNLAGDDTDAHIDTLARFCSADTIAYSACEDSADPHYASLKQMETQLRSFRTCAGEPYQLAPLPLPQAIYDDDGQRLPGNYANFLIINGAVMAPVYDDPMDDVALARLTECFPEHDIIATPCRPLIHQYGSLHCMTMQFPAIVDLKL